MNPSLSQLVHWFPSGTAEGEKAILEHVFVYVEEFANIMGPQPGNPQLLIGTKGSGKSAIIDFAMRILDQQNVPSVLLTPTDIDTSKLDDNSSTGDSIRSFSSILLSAIATKLNEKHSGFLTGDAAVLYNEAVISRNRPPDFVGKMSRFLAGIARPLVKVDLNATFKHLTEPTRKDLERAVARSISTNSFYLFIDDTDQVSNPEKPGHLNRVWALLLAVRRLTSDVPEIKAAITLRTEVWERLKIDPSGQRDQTDHFTNLCITLRSDREHVAKIVDRRLSLAAGSLDAPDDPYNIFFLNRDARAPYSEERRSWRDLIAVRSRARPRDAIQLVNQLAQRASSEHKRQIDEDVFRSVIPAVSERVAKEFAQEVALECPVVLEILRTFASAEFDSGAFTMSAEQARSHFKMILSKFGIVLYGHTLSQSAESSIFELWRFLYLCGFFNARVTDSEQKDGYRHIDPEKDIMLVSKPRWNDVQKALWEINTVYRDYLISVGREESVYTGLATKRRHRKKGFHQ